ncbi:MAG: DUF3871 family protein [Sediminibacterium sp.]|nr:DUF3871 family protein [Sediminibacterium sp.]
MEHIEQLTETVDDQENGTIDIPLATEQPDKIHRSFIEANTIASSLHDIKRNHIIPVYIKDNETLISQTDFIETTMDVVRSIYCTEQVLQPIVRVSHPMKGRIPDARDKPANELQDHEKTLYYERMAFLIEIPSIQGTVGDNTLSLTVGGVKSYSQDNLYGRKGSDEHFKVFIGFKNTVCTNLCVWTDGYLGVLKVNTMGQLTGCIRTLIENYNAGYHIQQMEQLTKYSLTEQQFAILIGRCRMYQHLPNDLKKDIPSLLLGDTQIGMACKDFYRDESFCRNENGTINLWRLYNLFTGANKTSYIDSFLDRSVNAYHFIEQLRFALQNQTNNWFLN